MSDNIKVNIEKLVFKILVVFTFCIIGSKAIIMNEITTYVEFSTVFMVIFGVVFCSKYKKYKRYIRESIQKYKFIYGFTVAYLVWNIVVVIVNFNLGVLLYYVNKLIPIVFLLVLLPYLRAMSSEEIENYKKYVVFSILVGCTIALVMYIFQYTNGAFSFKKFLNLVSFEQSKELYGEVRLYGLLSHKARFVVYCLIGLITAYKSLKISINIKKVAYVIFGICIVLSNSMMGLGIYLCILITIILEKMGQDKLLKYIKDNKKKVIGIVTLIFIVGIAVIIFIGTKRDLSTLGHRTYIWTAGINKVLENSIGIGVMPNELWIEAIYNGEKVYFTNAHSSYINEFIEIGIIGGALYLGFIASIFVKSVKEKNIITIVFYILVFGVMMNFESIDIREMKNILILIYPFYMSVRRKDEEINDSNMYI